MAECGNAFRGMGGNGMPIAHCRCLDRRLGREQKLIRHEVSICLSRHRDGSGDPKWRDAVQ